MRKENEGMDDNRYARFKRIYEQYQADPEYRRFIREDADAAAEAAGLFGSDGAEVLEAVMAVLGGKIGEHMDNQYVAEFAARIQPVLDYAFSSMAADRYKNSNTAAFVEKSLRRSRMESALFRRNTQIRYIPLAFELSVGCKVGCSFCGLEAGRFKENYPYREGREQWRRICSSAYDFLGEIAGQAPLYFATEPLDHPDYEGFLSDVMEITGQLPQTTTAAAERDTDRTTRLMSFIGEEGLRMRGRLRISIRSLGQFKKIMEDFSPEELIGVELIINNPESVKAISVSGRLYKRGAFKDRLPVKYSVSCLSGVLVNLCHGTLTFMEPVMPDESHRRGIREFETVHFSDHLEFADGIKELFNRYGRDTPEKEDRLTLNRAVRVVKKEDHIIFAGGGAGYSIKRNFYTEKLIDKLLSEKAIIFSELAYETGLSEEKQNELDTLIAKLFEKGYIVLGTVTE